MNLAFFQSSGASPDCHILSKNWEWPPNHVGQWCTASCPTDLFGLFKCSLFWSSFTESRFSLLKTFPLASGALDSRMPSLTSKDHEDIKYPGLSPALCHPVPCPTQQYVPIFPSLPFTADVSLEALLVTFHICCHIQLQMYFGFVTPPLHAWMLPLYSYNKYFPFLATIRVHNKILFKKAKNRTSHFKFSFHVCDLQFYSPDL